MKNLFRSLLAAAVLFGAAACTTEDISTSVVGNGDPIEVTFTADLGATNTRAYGEGKMANELIVKIYDAHNDDALLSDLCPQADEITYNNGKFTFNVVMVKGMEYKILLWAQNSACAEVYTVKDDKTLEIDYSKLANKENNNEKLDAFYYYTPANDTFDPTEDQPYFELRRPFAQLNAYTNDMAAVRNNGIVKNFKSSVTVSAYTSFNFVNGKVLGNPTNVTFDATAIPSETDGYLSMNYLLASNDGSLVNATYVFTGDRNDDSPVRFTGTEYNDVPLKSNHRTNILGALLTKPTDFVVDIKADFGTPDEVVNVVSTAAGLQQTINEATDGEQTEIVLDGDINLNDLLVAGTLSTRAATPAALTIPADKEITLNLNGKNLTYTTDVWNNDMIQNNGNLTIKDGNVIYTFTGELDTINSKGNYAINNAGSLTIEANVTTKYKDVNGKVSHALYAINTTGNVVVNNGTILNNNGYAVRVLAKNESNFTVNGGILEGIRAIWLQLPGSDTSVAPQATINVNGGTLIGTGEGDYKLAIYSYSYGNSLANINLNIAGGTLEGDIALTGGKNKEAIETVNISGGTLVDVYSYGDNAAAAQAITITGGTFSSLNPLTYLNSATEVVTLNSNIENAETIAFTGEGSLNLNGKTVSATDTTEVGYELINNSGNLTIEGEGAMTVTATHNNGWNRRSSVVSNSPGGNLTVKNGAVIEHLGGTDMAYGIDNLTNGKGTYAVTTIEGATIKSSYSAVRQFLNGTEATNELYVKAGATLVSPNRAVFFQDPSKNPNTGKLVIEEGASVTGKVHLSVTEGSTEWPVEVSVAASALKNDSQVTYSNVPTGYNVVEENGVWTVTYTCAAKIGETEYNSLQAALEAVQADETIVLQRDLNITTPAYGQNALNYTKAVNATIDLNGKTLSADTGNSVLRFNITNSGATSDVVLTIKNGTVTAGENTWCALMASGIDGANAVMNIQNVVVNNSKPGDLGIKAWDKGVINAEGVTVNSTKCAGGFYAVGGEVVLTNCTVNQKGLHTAPYLSMAVAVSSGGKMTINSGTYTTEPTAVSEGYNQGTSHGSWCGGVMNSGGELTINGGTFANGNFGDDALATAARGLIFGDTASVITINDGTFNALKSIIDYQNNLGIQPNPNIVINGGDFSANPAVVASYGGVVLAEGKVPAQGANGRWTLVDAITTEAGLVAALAEGGNITLGADITVSDPVVVPQGVTATLNLNGKTLASADEASTYALNNHGTLTIKGNGTINARGIYNGYGNGSDNVATAKLTIENGTFNAKGSNGGAAIFNYGIVEVKGGDFTSIGGYSLNNQTGASMTIADGVTANNGIYASGATLTINGGQINGNRSGCHVVYCWNTTITINGGTFYNYNSGNSTLMAAGTTTMTVNGGTFGIQDGRVPGNGNTWTSCLTDTQSSASMTVNDGTFNGGFRVQAGTTMTINGGSFNDCYGSNYNIYGSAVVKGGSYTDTPAQNFAKKYVADGYELNANGVVVAK